MKWVAGVQVKILKTEEECPGGKTIVGGGIIGIVSCY
jgi:hypothetical protein